MKSQFHCLQKEIETGLLEIENGLLILPAQQAQLKELYDTASHLAHQVVDARGKRWTLRSMFEEFKVNVQKYCVLHLLPREKILLRVAACYE